jgi:hypothetical protein
MSCLPGAWLCSQSCPQTAVTLIYHRGECRGPPVGTTALCV